MSAPHAVIGVDLGGTKADLRLAVGGETVADSRIPTDAADGAERVLARVCEEAGRLSAGTRISAIGLAVPGVVANGAVRRAPHIPGLEGLAVDEVVARHLPGARLRLLNDLDSAACALARRSEGAPASMLMAVGLGTGIAAGASLRGELLSSSSHAVGEIGDALVPIPGGGGLAPLETLSGGRALDAIAAEYGLAGAAPLLDMAQDAQAGSEMGDRVRGRLELLAGTLAVAARMIDASHMVLFGGLTVHPLVRGHIDAALLPHVGEGLAMRWAEPGERPALQGAMHAAMSAAGESAS